MTSRANDAFSEVQKPTVLVTENLDFHVSGAGDIALQEHRRVAESSKRFTLRGFDRLNEIVGALDDAHTLAAATGSSLHEERVADLGRVCRIFTALCRKP